MSTLVIAEHDNNTLKVSTLNTVAAAQAMGGAIDILVAGANCAGVATAAAAVPGIGKVLVADNAVYGHQLAENISLLIAEVATGYDAILAPATPNCKNFMPRVAALLDVAQISDVTSVESVDTFQRPIYAGNVIATVQSTDAKKVLTVRTTAYDAALATGGSATIEALSAVHDAGLSSFVSEEVAVSERPELTSAKVVISGGRGMQKISNCWMELPISLVPRLALRERQLMPDLYPMTCRWVKREKLSPRTSISPWEFQVRSSTWRA
jgi:electron transfer flavoprotein alpha subunit